MSNAYDIRCTLLRMAHDILSQERDDQNNIMFEAIATEREKGLDGDPNGAALKYQPKTITPGRVVEAAQELQKFVNKKD